MLKCNGVFYAHKMYHLSFAVFFYTFKPYLFHLSVLKAVDTIGNCQRPVFSLGVSQHKHKITNL